MIRIQEISENSKTKFKKSKGKQTKTTISQMVRKDFKQLSKYDVKRSLGSIVDVVNPLASIRKPCPEITEIYEKLDNLKDQEKKHEFQKLVIDSVKHFCFIKPYSRPEYEHDLDYALPFYFLTGLQGILDRSNYISKLVSEPDSCIRLAKEFMGITGKVIPTIRCGSIAAISLFQLNLLCSVYE